MSVMLIQHTGLRACVMACNTCMHKVTPMNLRDEELDYTGLNKAIKSGHWSVLEHCYLTFKIYGVSRACAQQITRHRLMSVSMESQRYVKGEYDEVTYQSMLNDLHLDENNEKLLNKGIEICYKIYNELINRGISKEKARSILPMITPTNLLVSMNLRAFIEQSQKRLCFRAQEEIRDVYEDMKRCLISTGQYNSVYNYINPPCMLPNGKCHESNPCGRHN